MSPLLEVRNISRRFGGLQVLHDVNFEVPENRIVGLIGPNGAGKSTLIKMLTTLLPPSSGRALVTGFDVVIQPGEVRRHIGYVPQLLSADGEMTGYENLLI